MTFYMTWANKYPDLIMPAVHANNIPLMRNAYHRYSTRTDRFLPLQYPQDGQVIIDSGGFNVLANGHDSFPWSVHEYHDWLGSLDTDFDWAACMDYACERRFDDRLSKEERMQKTLENTITHFNLDPSYRVLPVLQGRTLDDYLTFYDWLTDHGIPTEYVGLGTVCRQSNTTEIIEIERGLRANTDIEKLHGFGVKINAFKFGVCFESADSNAWNVEPSNGNVVYDDGDRLRTEERPDADQSQQRSYTSFLEYYKYASRLQNRALQRRDGRQQALSSFVAD